jgi:NitT/TauT family transport system substrate-binding protein
MCGYHGDRNFPQLERLGPSRRSFLRTGAAGTLTVALAGSGLGAAAHAATGTTFKGTHGSGFCNSAFFITHARQLAKADGLTLEFVNTPTFAEQVTFFGSGQVDVSVLPYTSFLALYDAGAPVKIVGGGGIEGCVVIGQPGLDKPEKLKGKTLGTFQLDTLEVLPYDWLKKNGIKFNEVTVRYLGSTPEQVEAFKARAIDFACVIEPYASALLNDVQGAVMLSNGVDIYGPQYTDCVLAASKSIIQQQPAALTALVKAMLRGQLIFEDQREEFLKETVGAYYKTSLENARIGAQRQPPKVDQRAEEHFILTRVDSLMEMGYIKKKPGKDAIDWSFLERAIAAVPDVYGKLKYKSA